MRTPGLVVLAALLSACVSGSGTSPQAAITTPAASLNCRLPVYQVGYQRTGFITFPGATFAEDPTGRMVSLPAPSTGSPIDLVRTVRQPELRGPGGPFYSRSAGRWLPVQREAVSPDGRRYTYAEPYWSDSGYPTGSRVHVVDVTTGEDRVVYDVGAYTVIDFAAEGIYVQEWNRQYPVGLVLLDPAGGQPRQIVHSDTITWTLVESGAAWGHDVDSSTLTRFDLTARTSVIWLRSPDGRPITIVAVDGHGAPFVVHLLESPAQELLLVLAPNDPQVIAPDFRPADIRIAHDSHGIWFGGPELNAVSLYTPQTGLKTLAIIGQDPGQEHLWVTGGCA